jgi:hypothetical protein
LEATASPPVKAAAMNCSFSSHTLPVMISEGRDWIDGGPMDLPLTGSHSGRSWRLESLDDQYFSILCTSGCDSAKCQVSYLKAFVAVYLFKAFYSQSCIGHKSFSWGILGLFQAIQVDGHV